MKRKATSRRRKPAVEVRRKQPKQKTVNQAPVGSSPTGAFSTLFRQKGVHTHHSKLSRTRRDTSSTALIARMMGENAAAQFGITSQSHTAAFGQCSSTEG